MKKSPVQSIQFGGEDVENLKATAEYLTVVYKIISRRFLEK
jgi:hypothetical protein